MKEVCPNIHSRSKIRDIVVDVGRGHQVSDATFDAQYKYVQFQDYLFGFYTYLVIRIT